MIQFRHGGLAARFRTAINAPPTALADSSTSDTNGTIERRATGAPDRCIAVHCSAASVAAADAPPLILEHLTTSDGLPQATVMTTLQDSQGFVWLGTEDGLVRYDGHELHRYAHSAHGAELAARQLRLADRRGRARRSVDCDQRRRCREWNRRSDTFTSYRHDPNDASSLASDRVRTVLIDARGYVWIGTFDAGVDVLDPSSGRIEHLRHDANDPASLGSDHVSTLALDRAGDVWIGTDKDSIAGAPTRARSFASARPSATRTRSATKRSRRARRSDRRALDRLALNAGLVRMDRDGRVLETFRHDARNPTSLGSDDVRAILEDQAGHLWVGTADGLALLDRSTRAFSHYRHDANDSASLRDSFVMSLYQDRDGLVWVGTRTGGVSRWNPRSWELGGHRPAWLENQSVTAFADAPDNNVWIASLAAGLVRFDAATGVATPLSKLVGRENPLGDGPVTSLKQDSRGALWIGTIGHGLKVLTPDGRIESIPVRRGDSRSLAVDGVQSILESRDGEIWIGTFDGGVNVLDPATRTVRQLAFGSSAGEVSAPNVTAMVEDTHGNLWLGTIGGGLDLARADGTVLKVFRNDPGNPRTLPANTVYALAVDGDGHVWVATDGGGLARVVDPGATPDAIEFQVLSRADGLSSDTLWGIVPDARGRLWLSGNAGLMRFDPETRAIKTYHREHGLQGEEFSFGAAFRLRDGRVAFGGPGGFNIFDPATLSENTQPPRVALTSVEVLGVRAAGDTPFWLRDRVALDYRGTIVSLDFGVLDFTSPTHNRLAYRMTGLTDDWIDLGAQRRVTLTNLDSGDHVLEVRAANSDSVWSTTPLKLTIHRDPAPWASPARLCDLRARAARARRTADSPTPAEVPGDGASAGAPRIRSAAAHARASRKQSAARRSRTGQERLPRSHESRAAHADERRGRHDRASVPHDAVADAVASHEDDPLVRADPAADRQRLARSLEDPRRQGRARSAADRSWPGARGMHEPVRRRGRGEGHRAHRVPARACANACCSATRCACARSDEPRSATP